MSALDVVTFLSDFGRADAFVGICHGVLHRDAPHARIIDLTHDVPAHDVRTGAVMLARAVRHLPPAVHLAVVDPGVGTTRRGVVIATERGDVLVGPDNGLLWPAALVLGVGGVRCLPGPSGAARTFDGRDVFAPAAAAIAAGRGVDTLGPGVDDPVRLQLPGSVVAPGRLEAVVVLIDRFGNVQLHADAADAEATGLGDELEVLAGGTSHPARQVTAFGELGPGELGLLLDSDGFLALVHDRAAAAATLAVRPGSRIVLSG